MARKLDGRPDLCILETIRGEVRVRKIFAALIALATAASGAPAVASACTLEKLVELPLHRLGDEAVVDASIDGAPIKFLVDTGASDTVLTRGGAEKLKMKARDIYGLQYYGVGGGDIGGQVHVKEIRLGQDVLRNVDLVVNGRIPADAPFQGLLGENSLDHGDLELDYAHDALRLIRPSGCDGDQVAYWGGAYSVVGMERSDNDTLLVTVVLNGHPVLAMIDSGASSSMVSESAARWAGVAPGRSGVTSIGETGGIGAQSVKAYQANFATLAIGGEVIRNVKLAIGDLFGADVESKTGSRIDREIEGLPEMLIGADFVRSHRIYVARGQRKVYFSYLGGPVFRDLTPRERAAQSAKAEPVAGKPPAERPDGGPTPPR